jgi:hypothetical protein
VATKLRICALRVDGKAERFDGTLLEVDAKAEEYRGQGKSTVYLFSADTEDEFARKMLAERNRTRLDSF